MKKLNWLLLLILVSCLPLVTFLKPGLPITHDGQDQVARVANFYQGLSEGNLIPRWAANLNWGYGHPILMFLYPLPSYVASLFHRLAFSLVDSVKITFALSFILSGVFMYLWIKEIWDEKAGFVAGLVYMFAPYRFVDLYVRGALGECWAFVWSPLICYFALRLSKKFSYRHLMGGSFSLAALILSHNALSLMFLPIILGYMGYLTVTAKKNYLLLVTCYLLLVTFAFGLSFFFWFPALAESKYTLRDIVTKNQIVGFEPLSRLLWSAWNYGHTNQFSVQVGPLQWLVVLLAPILVWQYFRRKDRFWQLLAFLFVCFWFSILMILPIMRPVYLKISLLQKFQFAWRWLSVAIFPPAVFAGAAAFFAPKRFRLLYTCFFILASLYLNKNYWQPKGFLFKEESFYTQPYASPTDTGESAPVWSVRFMEKYPKVKYEVIESQATIEEISRSTTRHIFKVSAVKPSRLVDNTLYFPNWQVLIDGQPTEIQFQDPRYRGLITFNVPAGTHEVMVQFSDTKLRQFANLVSIISLFLVILGAKLYYSLRYHAKRHNHLVSRYKR